MMIRIAEIKDLENILQITRDTISMIYSHYYAKGVVDFFLEHHSRENQSRGYGSQLMDFAESKITEKFSYVHVDSSLAAKEMYLKRGYKEEKTCRILADNGDILIYDEMEKGHC